jgi:hypothetical protein
MAVQTNVTVTVLEPISKQEVQVELSLRSNIFVNEHQETILNVNGIGSIVLGEVEGIS